jgi:hypothetical protein
LGAERYEHGVSAVVGRFCRNILHIAKKKVCTVLETWSPRLREEGASEEDAMENVGPTRDGVRLL